MVEIVKCRNSAPKKKYIARADTGMCGNSVPCFQEAVSTH